MTDPLLECANFYLETYLAQPLARGTSQLMADFARIVSEATWMHVYDCDYGMHQSESCQVDIAKRVTARLEAK